MDTPNTCPACGVSKDFPNVAIVELDEQEGFNLYRCSKCGLLFVHPVPRVQHDKLIREPVRRVDFLTAQKIYFQEVLEKCEIFLSPGSRILGFACGFGTFIAIATKAGHCVEGVDLTLGCRQYIKEQMPNITVYSELGEIPSDTERYDLVTAFEVLYYTPSPREILYKLQTLLRPGGRIVVALSANRGWLIWLLSRIKRSPVEVKKGYWITSTLLNGLAYYAFSTKSLIRLMESAGFTDIRQIRLRPPAPKWLRYRIPLFIWLTCADILRVLTLGKVVLYTKAHVIARLEDRKM